MRNQDKRCDLEDARVFRLTLGVILLVKLLPTPVAVGVVAALFVFIFFLVRELRSDLEKEAR